MRHSCLCKHNRRQWRLLQPCPGYALGGAYSLKPLPIPPQKAPWPSPGGSGGISEGIVCRRIYDGTNYNASLLGKFPYFGNSNLVPPDSLECAQKSPSTSPWQSTGSCSRAWRPPSSTALNVDSISWFQYRNLCWRWGAWILTILIVLVRAKKTTIVMAPAMLIAMETLCA